MSFALATAEARSPAVRGASDVGRRLAQARSLIEGKFLQLGVSLERAVEVVSR